MNPRLKPSKPELRPPQSQGTIVCGVEIRNLESIIHRQLCESEEILRVFKTLEHLIRFVTMSLLKSYGLCVDTLRVSGSYLSSNNHPAFHHVSHNSSSKTFQGNSQRKIMCHGESQNSAYALEPNQKPYIPYPGS